MELLCDMSHVESRFGPFGDIVVLVQDRCTVYAKCTIGSEIVFKNPMVLLGDEAQLEARFVHLDMVLIFTQDRCTICAERTIG
jgi:hypothetical protein